MPMSGPAGPQLRAAAPSSTMNAWRSSIPLTLLTLSGRWRTGVAGLEKGWWSRWPRLGPRRGTAPRSGRRLSPPASACLLPPRWDLPVTTRTSPPRTATVTCGCAPRRRASPQEAGGTSRRWSMSWASLRTTPHRAVTCHPGRVRRRTSRRSASAVGHRRGRMRHRPRREPGRPRPGRLPARRRVGQASRTRAGAQGNAQLGRAENQEDHGLPGAARFTGPHAGNQGHGGHEGPHEQEPRPQAGAQHALLGGPGRMAHRVRGDGLRAERDTGQAVREHAPAAIRGRAAPPGSCWARDASVGARPRPTADPPPKMRAMSYGVRRCPHQSRGRPAARSCARRSSVRACATDWSKVAVTNREDAGAYRSGRIRTGLFAVRHPPHSRHAGNRCPRTPVSACQGATADADRHDRPLGVWAVLALRARHGPVGQGCARLRPWSAAYAAKTSAAVPPVWRKRWSRMAARSFSAPASKSPARRTSGRWAACPRWARVAA